MVEAELKLPLRNADTMSMAIEMSSPSGHMSKRAHAAAVKRLAFALWGTKGMPCPTCKQPTKYETLMRQAGEFRELAGRGMHPRSYIKQAEMHEAMAKAIPVEKR